MMLVRAHKTRLRAWNHRQLFVSKIRAPTVHLPDAHSKYRPTAEQQTTDAGFTVVAVGQLNSAVRNAPEMSLLFTATVCDTPVSVHKHTGLSPLPDSSR